MNTTSSSPLHVSEPIDRAGAGRAWSQADASTRPSTNGGRALVLGGGGSTGNAWLIGVLAGLFDARLGVTSADLTIGTSAGATAAAQLTGAAPGELFAAIHAQQPAPSAETRGGTLVRPVGPRGAGTPIRSAADHLETTNRIIASASDASDMRRRIGAAALRMAAAADEERRAQWRATVGGRLSGQHWPQQRMLITAVDARTGEPVVFDGESGVDLVDAVAASCSGGLPYRIGDDWYIDGGYRRNENADLALGCGRALVLSPLGGRTRHPLAWGMQLAAQVDELRAGGSRVETIFPDPAVEHLFGANAMNVSLRPAAAHAGYDQGAALAGRLSAFWA